MTKKEKEYLSLYELFGHEIWVDYGYEMNSSVTHIKLKKIDEMDIQQEIVLNKILDKTESKAILKILMVDSVDSILKHIPAEAFLFCLKKGFDLELFQSDDVIVV